MRVVGAHGGHVEEKSLKRAVHDDHDAQTKSELKTFSRLRGAMRFEGTKVEEVRRRRRRERECGAWMNERSRCLNARGRSGENDVPK